MAASSGSSPGTPRHRAGSRCGSTHTSIAPPRARRPNRGDGPSANVAGAAARPSGATPPVSSRHRRNPRCLPSRLAAGELEPGSVTARRPRRRRAQGLAAFRAWLARRRAPRRASPSRAWMRAVSTNSCAMPASAVTRMPVAMRVSRSVKPRCLVVEYMPQIGASGLPFPCRRRDSQKDSTRGLARDVWRVQILRCRAPEAQILSAKRPTERQPNAELRAAFGRFRRRCGRCARRSPSARWPAPGRCRGLGRGERLEARQRLRREAGAVVLDDHVSVARRSRRRSRECAARCRRPRRLRGCCETGC